MIIFCREALIFAWLFFLPQSMTLKYEVQQFVLWSIQEIHLYSCDVNNKQTNKENKTNSLVFS